MDCCHQALTRLYLVLTRHVDHQDETGDVPGWVLVTVMTAGIVGALYGIAKPQLSEILSDAINSVK